MTLKRTAFGRYTLVRKPPTVLGMVRRAALGVRPEPSGAVMAQCSGAAPAQPKTEPARHEGYRRLVAALPCKHCGIAGFSQAAHPNTDKGAGTKTDDRLCFPLCTVHLGAGGYLEQGCHERFDQGALFSKAVRREIEPAWGADTRRQIEAMGQWPKGLPLWTE